MKIEEIDKLIWSCIKPAKNRVTPCDSDGYNESEVFSACRKLYVEIGQKAEKWQELQDKLNEWSRINEDGPTNELIADTWWNIVNNG